jgi:hypothetical protein
MSIFLKISPVGAEVFHAEGKTERQTDMTKLLVALCNFANTPKNLLFFAVNLVSMQ